MINLTPHLKNYKVFKCLNNMDTLMPELMRGGIVYFLPAGKVMPTKFFIGYSWNKRQALIRHMEVGNFWMVKSYESITRTRIRRQLEKCDKIPIIIFSGYSQSISLNQKQ